MTDMTDITDLISRAITTDLHKKDATVQGIFPPGEAIPAGEWNKLCQCVKKTRFKGRIVQCKWKRTPGDKYGFVHFIVRRVKSGQPDNHWKEFDGEKFLPHAPRTKNEFARYKLTGVGRRR